MKQTHGTWGKRFVTWEDDTKLIAILYLNPKKRCSWHSHKHSYNQFFVIEGELVIKTDIGPGSQRNYTTIKKGQTFEVGPGVYHEFRTKDMPAIVEEIAFVSYDKTDISRNQLGGDCECAIPVD
jgi:mannose-6-phosphate isomerase-like protein (cupin superfamily)